MEAIQKFLAEFEAMIYGPWFVLLLLGTGIWLSVKTRFVQFRKMGTAIAMIFSKDSPDNQDSAGDITPLQALSTALAATVGLGNIAGVATAVSWGGPGAIFWMWLTALCGMATIYSESLLSMKFRRQAGDGTMASGPMYYLTKGFKNKKLGTGMAFCFALAGALAALLGTGNLMQSNSIATSFQTSFGMNPWVSGIIIAVLTGAVTIGGIRRVGMVAEKLVPAMIFLYIGACLLIIGVNIAEVPAMLALILKSAFNVGAVSGGAAGGGILVAMQYGISRGILSNEAGLGTSPIAHGAAREKDPDRQGLLSMNGVFIDTLVVCTMTALVILVAGDWHSGLNPTDVVVSAFETVIPHGHLVVTLCALLFGFSTLLGWSYYGEQCIQYLLGIKVVGMYRYLFVLLVFAGAVTRIEIVWSIGTIAIAFMALPNLFGLLILSPLVGKLTGNAMTLDVSELENGRK